MELPNPAPDSPDGRHAETGANTNGTTIQASLQTARTIPLSQARAPAYCYSLGHRGACAEELPGGGGDAVGQILYLRLRRTGRGADQYLGRCCRGYVTGRAPGAYARTHALTLGGQAPSSGRSGSTPKREGGAVRFGAGGGWVGVCVRKVLRWPQRGRRYGSHAGPNAAGRRARRPCPARGGPRAGTLEGPGCAVGTMRPPLLLESPRDRGPRGGTPARRGQPASEQAGGARAGREAGQGGGGSQGRHRLALLLESRA